MNVHEVFPFGQLVKVRVPMTAKKQTYTARVTGQFNISIPSVHNNSITSVTVIDPGNTDKEIGSPWDVGTNSCTLIPFGPQPADKVGILAAGDIVTAYSLPTGEPTEAMVCHYTVCIGANMDVEVKTVTSDQWERIKAALSEIDDVEIQDFTTA